MRKSVVTNTEAQNPVFKWLTQKELNGWNDRIPDWNFSKYLIDEQGVLTHYFGPGISPVSKRIIHAINLTSQ
jgi:glutathione peroxidase